MSVFAADGYQAKVEKLIHEAEDTALERLRQSLLALSADSTSACACMSAHTPTTRFTPQNTRCTAQRRILPLG